MTPAGEIAPHELYSSMELEEVFLHFLNRFENLPDPRSVAEARVTSDEVWALTDWFSGQDPRMWYRMWCESTAQVRLSGEVFASRREMFGALLLIIGSELCRANSNEDSVWPAVTGVLQADRLSFAGLFVGGQPSITCKNALAAGARRLKLRSLIDRYGAQDYFDTLKLQFGFTRRGGARRLSDWLDGLGLPIAVRILTGVEPDYGDLMSPTFTDLWTVLHDFRRNRVSESRTFDVLDSSPWVGRDWVPELMVAARLRSDRTVALVSGTEMPAASSEPLCDLFLRWDYPAKPQLSLLLNEEQIYEMLVGRDTATFAIDGRVVERWTLQEAGAWRGRRELPCQPAAAKPNLRPNRLSVSSEGEPLEEVDLFEIGMGEPLLIFDLRSGTLISPTSRLDTKKDYALLCDADLSVPGVTPALKATDRVVYRMAGPWCQDLKVICDGATYWQPTVDQREPLPPIRLKLESLPSQCAEIGSACHVNIVGVPDKVTSILLVVAGKFHSTIRRGDVWQTERPLQITLGIALGEQRVRIRLCGSGWTRTVTPKCSLSLRGVAYVETDSDPGSEPEWTLLPTGRPLDRAGGAATTARIFLGNGRYELFEGSRFVGKVGSRPLLLRELCGWGAPLTVRSPHQPPSVVVESVEDRGRGTFVPSLFRGRTNAHLVWHIPMTPSAKHTILFWEDVFRQPKTLPAGEVTNQQDDFVWKLPNLGLIAAMAIAYDGTRIASYWDRDQITQALTHGQSSQLFALLRWLKVPVLNSSFREPMREAVLRRPAEFVKGWMNDSALPLGLVQRQSEQGLDVVIREFLWNYVERNENTLDKLAGILSGAAGPTSGPDAFRSTLSQLGEVCPSLSYNFARVKLRGAKFRKYVLGTVAAMLRQPETAEVSQLHTRLAADRRDCASLIGIEPEALENSVNAFGAYLDNQAPGCYPETEADLRRLGESARGRQFLIASLLIRLVERNRF